MKYDPKGGTTMMRFTNLLTVMMLSVLFVIGLMQLTEIKNISALVVSLSPSRQAQDSKTEVPTINVVNTAKGNGAPSGSHYNLNILGKEGTRNDTVDSSNGHVIFVPLYGNSKIMLGQGSTFRVIDSNALDGKATFQMPNPDPDNDGVTVYSVWARALGKPGGNSEMTTCTTDLEGVEWCSVYSMVSVRTTGKSSFSDVSKQLLYIYADINLDGTLERYPVFDPALQDYFWNYDNNGLRLLQLRFYPISSNVN